MSLDINKLTPEEKNMFRALYPRRKNCDSMSTEDTNRLDDIIEKMRTGGRRRPNRMCKMTQHRTRHRKYKRKMDRNLKGGARGPTRKNKRPSSR